jgi:hypothetical protein
MSGTGGETAAVEIPEVPALATRKDYTSVEGVPALVIDEAEFPQ